MLLKLNIEAPFRLIRAVVPEMKAKNYGRIVNIGSISGAVGEANASLYSLTKSAFSGMTKRLRWSLRVMANDKYHHPRAGLTQSLLNLPAMLITAGFQRKKTLK